MNRTEANFLRLGRKKCDGNRAEESFCTAGEGKMCCEPCGSEFLTAEEEGVVIETVRK